MGFCVQVKNKPCIRRTGYINLISWIHPHGSGTQLSNCSETALTRESRFHISTPLGIEPGVLMTGGKWVVQWTSEQCCGAETFCFCSGSDFQKVLAPAPAPALAPEPARAPTLAL